MYKFDTLVNTFTRRDGRYVETEFRRAGEQMCDYDRRYIYEERIVDPAVLNGIMCQINYAPHAALSISPAFSPDVFDYTLPVAADGESGFITLLPASVGAVITATFNGEACAAGSFPNQFYFSYDPDTSHLSPAGTFVFTITADGTTHKYTLTTVPET